MKALFLVSLILLSPVARCQSINANEYKGAIDLIISIDLLESGNDILEMQKPLLLYKKQLDQSGNVAIRNNKNVQEEKEFISNLIITNLKDRLMPVRLKDSICWREVLEDSIARRDVSLLENELDKCGVQNALLFDVTWKYLNHSTYEYLSYSRKRNERNFRTSVFGTWITIRVKYFENGKWKYGRDYLNLKIRGDSKPGRMLDRHRYAGFFKKASRDFESFFIHKTGNVY
jgi:hypothetical protein